MSKPVFGTDTVKVFVVDVELVVSIMCFCFLFARFDPMEFVSKRLRLYHKYSIGSKRAKRNKKHIMETTVVLTQMILLLIFRQGEITFGNTTK